MNIYVCHIDLKQESKALAFASALAEWMEFLKAQGSIGNWRLMRRKLNLTADSFRDFILEIEVENFAQLDQAFHLSGSHDEDIARKYHAVHDVISQADFGLYRPFPDDERAERMALL